VCHVIRKGYSFASFSVSSAGPTQFLLPDPKLNFPGVVGNPETAGVLTIPLFFFFFFSPPSSFVSLLHTAVASIMIFIKTRSASFFAIVAEKRAEVTFSLMLSYFFANERSLRIFDRHNQLAILVPPRFSLLFTLLSRYFTRLDPALWHSRSSTVIKLLQRPFSKL